MSRSYRKPSFNIACGSHPKEGKQVMSRHLRRKVRQTLHTEAEGFDFVHPQDKNRGDAGSRSEDFSWTYFGEGKVNPYQAAGWAKDDEDKKWFESLKRK